MAYSISGNDRDVFFLSSELDDAIGRTREWYSRIAHADVVQVFVGFLGVAFVALMLLAAVLAVTGRLSDESANAGDGSVGVVVYGLFIAALLLGSLANRIKGWLFPVAIFAWGKEKERAQRLIFWRQLIGGGVLLAFFVNLAAGLVLL